VREICGTELLFRVALRSNQVYLAASNMDDAVSEQTLLRTADSLAGWDLVRRLIAALETYRVRDLKRPVAVGNPTVNDPGSCWVIG